MFASDLRPVQLAVTLVALFLAGSLPRQTRAVILE